MQRVHFNNDKVEFYINANLAFPDEKLLKQFIAQ